MSVKVLLHKHMLRHIQADSHMHDNQYLHTYTKWFTQAWQPVHITYITDSHRHCNQYILRTSLIRRGRTCVVLKPSKPHRQTASGVVFLSNHWLTLISKEFMCIFFKVLRHKHKGGIMGWVFCHPNILVLLMAVSSRHHKPFTGDCCARRDCSQISKASVVRNNYDGGSADDVRGLQDWRFRHQWKNPHQAWMGWRSVRFIYGIVKLPVWLDLQINILKPCAWICNLQSILTHIYS